MGTRLTFEKQEIKQDKFADFMSNARESAEQNAITVASVILAVILLGVGIYFYSDSMASSEIESQTRLAQAKVTMSTGNLQLARLEFRAIADEYKGSDVGAEALYVFASTHFLGDNFVEAKRTFEEYVAKYDHLDITHAAALSGIAYCMENTGENGPAAEQFLKAWDYLPGGPAAEDYAIGSLRNYLQVGNQSAAEDIHKRIAKDFWQSLVIQSADRLMNSYSQNDS